MTTPLVSVIVCTYNRASLLRGCLDSLRQQSSDRQLFEVIVVDNNSTDTTAAVALEFAEICPHFRTVVATQQGLSCARNVGWQTAQGTYVAYIDDDAIAAPDWVDCIIQFATAHPEIQVFGGPYDAFTLRELPPWFPPEYGRLDFGDRTHPIELGPEWIPGSNMIFKQRIFKEYGGFDPELGMKGQQTAYGEEINLLARLNQAGIAIYYVPSLKVKHLIADYKMSLRWLLTSIYRAGCSASQTFAQQRSLYPHCAALVKFSLLAPIKLIWPLTIPLKRRLYYALYWPTWEAGALHEYMVHRWQQSSAPVPNPEDKVHWG